MINEWEERFNNLVGLIELSINQQFDATPLKRFIEENFTSKSEVGVQPEVIASEQAKPSQANGAVAGFMEFNLNNYIKFKWTEIGKQQYLKYFEELGITPVFPKTDENGYYFLQTWEFMRIFGRYMYNGCKQAIEENKVLIATASL